MRDCSSLGKCRSCVFHVTLLFITFAFVNKSIPSEVNSRLVMYPDIPIIFNFLVSFSAKVFQCSQELFVERINDRIKYKSLRHDNLIVSI